MAPADITVMFSALAAASWSTGISFGRIAVRVGWLTAKNACCRAKRPSSTHTLFQPANACHQNSPEVVTRPTVVISSRTRRSM